MLLNPDQADDMLSKLLEQYRGKSNMEFFIRSILAPQIQDLENALFSILADTNISTSFGAQLDGIGRLVDLARNGMDDTTYRLYLKAKVLANNSTGTLNELLTILKLLVTGTPTMTVLEPPDTDDATIEIVITSSLPVGIIAEIIAPIMMKAKAAAVRLLVTTFHAPAFAFDTAGHGFDQAGVSWGSTFGG